MYFPSMVVVASGVPGVPVVCWAIAGTIMSERATTDAAKVLIFMGRTPRQNLPGAAPYARRILLSFAEFEPGLKIMSLNIRSLPSLGRLQTLRG
jgi:hypothetical protein